jgi:hypothetical protein
MNGYTRTRSAPYTQAPGYRAPAPKPVTTPAAPIGQYPGPVPTYGKPPSYGAPPSYGPPPTYEFAPDPKAKAQADMSALLAMKQAAQEEAARKAELFQIQSQWHAPRQSRMTLLGGY